MATQVQNTYQILRSLAIGGYRSFGEQTQHFQNFSKINILIGQNNCGKSNVLRFIHEYLAQFPKQQRTSLSTHDRHLPNGGGGLRSGLLPEWFQDGKIDAESFANVSGIKANTNGKHALIKLISEKMRLEGPQYEPWFYFGADDKPQTPNWKNALESMHDGELQALWNQITGSTGGGRDQHWVPAILSKLHPAHPAFKCHLIPAIRKIGSKGSNSDEFSGEGIIDRLAKLQNPPAIEQENKERFKKIGDFLRTVTDNYSAQIEIPYERDTILVHMDGKTLPLDSLGSGIHEVIILAAAATVLEHSVICMEEPELHLNPILQKKLIRYLQTSTSNQYFITTHSAALMDTPNAEVYHITLIDGSSRVERATSDKQRSSVCEDLGYHPSDLLQTNCIIWVEGPSDRLYLKWWIQAIAPELVEGINYSIMFYGGRLASHVSGEDLATFAAEFISLRRLNRRGVILIDSDRAKKGGLINETKKRLRDEFDAGPGHAWITDGREIENYLDPIKLKATIQLVHPSMKVATQLEKYDNSLLVLNSKGEKVQASKVKVASRIIESERPDLDRLDLRKQVQRLVTFIRSSNPTGN